MQQLLAAKRDLRLPQMLKRLDVYDALILDDIGYIQQSPEEAEVLFTLMAERYERRSLIVTSNLVFSEWDRIFRTPMTTMAAIDRLVHHAVFLEFGGVTTYRGEAAQARGRAAAAGEGDAPASPVKSTGRRAPRQVAGALEHGGEPLPEASEEG